MSEAVHQPSVRTDIHADWDLTKLTPTFIASETDDVITKFRSKYREISQLDSKDVTWSNCVEQLMRLECQLETAMMPLTFSQNVAIDKAVREAAVVAEKKFNDFAVEIEMDQGIFDNVVAFQSQIGQLDDKIDDEFKRFVDRTVLNGRRNGLHLDDKTREEVRRVKAEISDLGTQFQSNLNESNTTLLFSEAELAGVPSTLLETLDRVDGKFKVTLQYPHYFPVTRKCRVPETRKQMDTAFLTKCVPENSDIMAKLVALRRRKAKLLGYPDHATFIQERRMAKDPKAVATFLDDLKVRLQTLWAKERQELLDLKKHECETVLKIPFDGKINFWDMRYYTVMVEEQRYAVDQEQLKPYFSLDRVTAGLFTVYQLLLGLKFVKMEDVATWHPEAELFRADDVSTGQTVGYFFMDLHPREGKYGHACMMGLQPGCLDPGRSYSVTGCDATTHLLPVCVMLANFTAPTATKPSLLDHREVVTYFHEFGHVMHHVCSKAKTAMLFGAAVERDFVEAPSQMLENWAWDATILRDYISGHHETGKPLPDDLIEALTKSKLANTGSFNLRQIALATFDQALHRLPATDCPSLTETSIPDLFSQTYQEVIGITPIPGTDFGASFAHLVGYDAQYYGYLWSEVFSDDMYSTVFRGKELDSGAGRAYREKILAPGATLDADEMLINFLGRPPTSDAFFHSKGL